LRDIDQAALTHQIGAVLDDFLPDAVVTFGPDGLYGHPDHVTIGALTTAAFLQRERGRLYHSHFSRSRLLLLDRLAEWLVDLHERFKGPADFARAFSLFAKETTTLGFADDHVEIAWYPPGVYIVEQGENADSLFLILAGEVEVSQDRPDGTKTFIRRQGPGEFFGELAIAQHGARTAHVVAAEAVTCMVFSRGAATAWAGRGGVSLLDADGASAPADPGLSGATTVIDVTSVIDKKIAAVAAHRTQYPIEPDMFPAWLLTEMMGLEYFVRVHPRPDFEHGLLA
jgi:LmbE family N-acetylglucosaminyl deacetylase